MLDVVVTERIVFQQHAVHPVAPQPIAPIVAEGIVAHDGAGADVPLLSPPAGSALHSRQRYCSQASPAAPQQPLGWHSAQTLPRTIVSDGLDVADTNAEGLV